jgi:hypothetical protein
MATMIIYNSFMEDLAEGRIDIDTDQIKVMLTTSAYTPLSGAHSKRSDVTNEVVGSGYSSGGVNLGSLTSSLNTGNELVVSLGATTFPTVSVTMRTAVYYKSRGGAASADELICAVSQTGDVTATAADLVQAASTLRMLNLNP